MEIGFEQGLNRVQVSGEALAVVGEDPGGSGPWGVVPWTLLLLNGGLAILWQRVGTHPFLALLEVVVINITVMKVLPSLDHRMLSGRRKHSAETDG